MRSTFILALMLVGCSGQPFTATGVGESGSVSDGGDQVETDGSGGSASTETGGAAESGGRAGTGGHVGVGSGGHFETGGSSSTGGHSTENTGGDGSGSGGASASTGGSKSTGGTTSTGGATVSTGGATASTGGATSTGGSPGSGGATGSCVEGAVRCSGAQPQLCNAFFGWVNSGSACPGQCSQGVCLACTTDSTCNSATSCQHCCKSDGTCGCMDLALVCR
jgi:hypothetical protein